MVRLDDLVRYIDGFLSVLIKEYDDEVAHIGLFECQKGIIKAKNAFKNAKTFGEKHHFQSCLNNITSRRTMIKEIIKKGGGLNMHFNYVQDRVRWADSESAFKSRLTTGVISNLEHKDPKFFLKDAKIIFIRKIQNILKKEKSVKVNVVFSGEFEIMKGDNLLKEFKYFTTANCPIYTNTKINEWFDEKVIKPILIDLEEFQERDSGWALKKVENLVVNISKYSPLRVSSYIQLPPQIAKKHACINVKNYDQACFAWAVTSALHPAKNHQQMVSSYPHYSSILKLKGIHFPMTERQIPNFEKQNNVSINLYILKKLKSNLITLPTYLTNNKKDQHVNLLLIKDNYDGDHVENNTNNPVKPQHHIPAAVGYYFKCSYDDSLSFYRSYRGDNCMKWFADEMLQLAEDIAPVFWCPYDIDMTSTEEAEFKKSSHCHICEQPFAPGDKKVRDHIHYLATNNFRGSSHEGCNINYQDSHVVSIVFHNLSGYDAHFVITDIATRIKGDIDLLPITKEKYISFTKHIEEYPIQFRFIDSFRFMASSLDKLASYLEEFPNLKIQFWELSEEQLNLLTKKGVMPYDYIDSFERFEETCLPPIELFYNKLDDKPCPHRLYLRAQEIWSKFNCRNLGQYVDLYMKTDIMLLADVFERFRNSCHKTYGLDPAHYYTLPGFTWDAMLKYTKQELDLLTDIDMFMFVESGIRGGLSQVCTKRRAHANNKYIENYDSSKPTNYLMYFDVNNQYEWAMSQFLPYGGFEWDNTNIDVISIPDDAPFGYILEVDLEYPEVLHDSHKDLPFCSEHINPKTNLPPKTSKELTKLMATLNSKIKYVIHYRTLKQALDQGLILKKIHRVLKFKQAPWLKSYIELNTELRKESKNEFEKNLFKLMNNGVFVYSGKIYNGKQIVKVITKLASRTNSCGASAVRECTVRNINKELLNKLETKLDKFKNTPNKMDSYINEVSDKIESNECKIAVLNKKVEQYDGTQKNNALRIDEEDNKDNLNHKTHQ
ncbi:unnamed protein product [Psylliodes chrysocephalus]|uniref:DNA-directed DNA polymerase n=1 Tax=Psylliodes chrysocephalus TaxID=3402493 RepID=A0A9P0G8K3_9CUCU|nr:unnamed protein product [Psylliodes chrysocephala]